MEENLLLLFPAVHFRCRIGSRSTTTEAAWQEQGDTLALDGLFAIVRFVCCVDDVAVHARPQSAAHSAMVNDTFAN